MKSSNLLFCIVTLFPILYLIIWSIPNYHIYSGISFEVEDRHILPDNMKVWGFIMKHENWVFVHLITPFFVYVYITQSVPWAIIVAVVWEMTEAIGVIMGFSMGKALGVGENSSFFVNWLSESAGDSWWGDLPQGTIGILIGAYLLRRYFPDILLHLRMRKHYGNQIILVICYFLLTAALDLVGLITVEMGVALPGVGHSMPIGYMVQILGLLGVFKLYWYLNDHRTMCCIPEDRLELFHSHLMIFLMGGWLSTAILIIPTYFGLWIFIGFYLAYVTLSTRPVNLKDGWLIDHSGKRIYEVGACEHLCTQKVTIYTKRC